MLRTSVDRLPYGFVEPCRPSKADRPPSGPQWVHEVKHDGFRLMVRRDGARVRCFTRNGHDSAAEVKDQGSALLAQRRAHWFDGGSGEVRTHGTLRGGWMPKRPPRGKLGVSRT